MSQLRKNSSDSDDNENDFQSYKSPKRNTNITDAEFNSNLNKVQEGLLNLQSLTQSIDRRVKLFNTSQDSRTNHKTAQKDIEKGTKCVSELKELMDSLAHGSSNKGAQRMDIRRRRSTQYQKVLKAFHSQVEAFNKLCESAMEIERETISEMRRSTIITMDSVKMDHKSMDEDRLYEQVEITTYDEDDLQHREEDVAHINNQMQQINAVYRELDGLVKDQEEAVVEIANNAEYANENVENALDEVRQADAKKGYCNCSKFQICIYTFLAILALILIISLTQLT